ncbi:hypothetical protein AC249_AIPGENE9418 [Exaiptasia diaphana]|nr:hypothetical protein AC249_AIPGENE9418 [Exaiptasia diaphana]
MTPTYREILKLKLLRVEKLLSRRARFDINKLRNDDIKKEFNNEVERRYQALRGTDDDEDIDEEHNIFLDVYREAGKKILGKEKKQSKQWISDITWQKIKERKEENQKLESTKSMRLKQRREAAYKAKSMEVKTSAREDKRRWIEAKADMAEKATENGRSREMYSITKTIVGHKKKQEVGVKDKHGVMKTGKEEKLKRWVEHFSEVLNREQPLNPVTTEELHHDQEIEEINIGEWSVDEVVTTEQWPKMWTKDDNIVLALPGEGEVMKKVDIRVEELDERCMLSVKTIADGTHPSIKVEVDHPSKHTDKKIPILDVKSCGDKYIGETSRSAFMRGKEHVKELDQALSTLYAERQITEAVRIRREGKKAINNKTEWNNGIVPRARIELSWL